MVLLILWSGIEYNNSSNNEPSSRRIVVAAAESDNFSVGFMAQLSLPGKAVWQKTSKDKPITSSNKDDIVAIMT